MSDETDQATEEVTDDERTLAILMHVLAIFSGFIAPLVLWLVKKDDSPFLDQHGKEALNFQISILIYGIAVGVIAIFTCGIGALLAIPLAILVLVGCTLAAIQGHKGERCSYPLTIRLIQ
jgi:hypothetical protein